SLLCVFVFSVVVISFGASASAVGGFLRQNRSLLAPIAGALIILFGLHLVGLLIKLTPRIGLIVGIFLVALALVCLLRHEPLILSLGPVHFFSLSVIGFAGPWL